MTAAGPARTRPQRSESADGQVLGLLLLLGGVAWLLDRSEVVDLAWITVLSALLAVLGVGMVVTARRRGGPGLFFLGAALTVVLAAASSVDLGLVGEGIDDRRIVSSAVDEAKRDAELHGELFAGQLTVDLTDLREIEGTTALRYRMGMGHLVIHLPPRSEVFVDVRTTVRGGKVEMPEGALEKGSDLTVRFVDPTGEGAPPSRLVVHLTMGFGAVQVLRDGG
jgi:hypothetical protein